MKLLPLVFALSIFASTLRAEELRFAVCSINNVVRNHPDYQALQRLAGESPSDVNLASLQREEVRLRAKAHEIIKDLATDRNYQRVFEVQRSRNEIAESPEMQGMLISFSGDDITDDVRSLLSKSTAEQAGTGQPATRPESKLEGGDKPKPGAEGRSR